VARPKLAVQHFVACALIKPMRLGREFAYQLSGVSYVFDVPSDREWPVRLDYLCLFVRFFNGIGTQNFDVDLVWLDSPDGTEEVFFFPEFEVHFGTSRGVASRNFPVAAARFPGPGCYEFRLRASGKVHILAREEIEIRRQI
jgi:hypothetical protein